MAEEQHCLTRRFGFSLLICLFSCVVHISADTVYISYQNNGELKLHTSPDVSWVAVASFENAINKTGWSHLTVQTNGSYDNKVQAYAAGVVEGASTQDLIKMHWYNTMDGYCKDKAAFCDQLARYLQENADWVQEQIHLHAATDPYWHHVDLFYTQLNGLRDGFHLTIKSQDQPIVSNPLDMFLLMQIGGDLEDLESALHAPSRRPVGSGSCSALIKLLPGNKDLLTSQVTWTGFNSMLRILKKYELHFRPTASSKKDGTGIAGTSMTFSSYPGSLTSGDDFYIISSGLVTLETTIGNDNSSLWQFVHPKMSVVEGVRSMVANRLASSGKEWTKLFSMYNSGTYNNQWMVVDYNHFKPGQTTLDPELFYVLEQVPGHIMSGSMTVVLQKQNYWPSYNLPYFPEIFEVSGQGENVKKYGSWFSYKLNPRAQIFRRDHVKVTDTHSMMKLMRYNDYTHDPLSRCNCTPSYSAENAISARSDLNPADGHYPFSALSHRLHGGTDMKMTSSVLRWTLDFMAVSSPTYDQVPTFRWSVADPTGSTRHQGHPEEWHFPPIQTDWASPHSKNTK